MVAHIDLLQNISRSRHFLVVLESSRGKRQAYFSTDDTLLLQQIRLDGVYTCGTGHSVDLQNINEMNSYSISLIHSNTLKLHYISDSFIPGVWLPLVHWPHLAPRNQIPCLKWSWQSGKPILSWHRSILQPWRPSRPLKFCEHLKNK